jgi:hypothetical protein
MRWITAAEIVSYEGDDWILDLMIPRARHNPCPTGRYVVVKKIRDDRA